MTGKKISLVHLHRRRLFCSTLIPLVDLYFSPAISGLRIASGAYQKFSMAASLRHHQYSQFSSEARVPPLSCPSAMYHHVCSYDTIQCHGDQCISSLSEKQHAYELIAVIHGLTCSISLNVCRLARSPVSSFCPDPVQRPCLDKLHQPLEPRYHESWRDMCGGISFRHHQETQRANNPKEYGNEQSSTSMVTQERVWRITILIQDSM